MALVAERTGAALAGTCGDAAETKEGVGGLGGGESDMGESGIIISGTWASETIWMAVSGRTVLTELHCPEVFGLHVLSRGVVFRSGTVIAGGRYIESPPFSCSSTIVTPS